MEEKFVAWEMVTIDGKGINWEKLHRLAAWLLFALLLGAGAALGGWLALGGRFSLGRLLAGLGALGAGVVAGLWVLSGAMLRLEGRKY